jgi:hypothetical protein
MNNTEYEMLTREQLLATVESLQSELEYVNSKLDSQIGWEGEGEDYDSGYADGLEESKGRAYEEGYEAGYEAAMEEAELHHGL